MLYVTQPVPGVLPCLNLSIFKDTSFGFTPWKLELRVHLRLYTHISNAKERIRLYNTTSMLVTSQTIFFQGYCRIAAQTKMSVYRLDTILILVMGINVNAQNQWLKPDCPAINTIAMLPVSQKIMSFSYFFLPFPFFPLVPISI